MGRQQEFHEGGTVSAYDNHWVNQRYGDRTEIPAPVERRAGPLPYPDTAEQRREAEAERDWGHWH